MDRNQLLDNDRSAKRQRVKTEEIGRKGSGDDDNKQPAQLLFRSSLDLPADLRIRILQYLEGDELGNFAMVSRQCWEDSRDPILPRGRTALIRCGRDGGFMPSWNPYSVVTFLGVLMHIQRACARDRFNNRFTSVKLVGHGGLDKVTNRDAKPVLRGVSLEHVTSLDLSLPHNAKKKDRKVSACIPRLLCQIMPNLKEVDFSYCDMAQSALSDVAKHCPLLEKITCHDGISTTFADGQDLRVCKNLKEIYMDSTCWYSCQREYSEVLFHRPDLDVCIFWRCLENLERVSIKDAIYFSFGERPQQPYTQTGLMKFVRLAPKLRWFRSDLTAGNIALLKAEKPHIMFES
jgi:hypothetical protein